MCVMSQNKWLCKIWRKYIVQNKYFYDHIKQRANHEHIYVRCIVFPFISPNCSVLVLWFA